MSTAEQNKALVLEAFNTLFNERDYEAASRFWSDNYIQHSPHIEPGRDGLFRLIRGLPDTLRYEHALIVAEDDYVIVHGRFQALAAQLRGSLPMSSGSKTVVWPNTGMCFKMKQHRRSPGVDCRCSEIAFLTDAIQSRHPNQWRDKRICFQSEY